MSSDCLRQCSLVVFISKYRASYAAIKAEWEDASEIFNREDVTDVSAELLFTFHHLIYVRLQERHRIDVDCRRTDRTQPLFMVQSDAPGASPEEDDEAQSRSNEHVDRIAQILLTYNFYEKELGMWRGTRLFTRHLLGIPEPPCSHFTNMSPPPIQGYVQGMSDLCAPLYVVCGTDEALTFWCFVSVMDRMVSPAAFTQRGLLTYLGQKINFLRDQSGMKMQLSTLQQLLATMDPVLYRHFEKTDALNLFFCFRWVLIAFKREFPFDEVLRLWEVRI